ncbi:RNA polymerase sigma factor SigJ [Diaminobutyricimonas sp. LJ205]|uniref:RNA polymerase sigma factor SigJ n=1 Tax=Diaminobutyricimonas sp. LJ205 TaxID=2683590 RepID=UPI0012F499B2|nr:RNA polymerase sigma factor SigJ [Diaminobutyricimonas sp. LJ205]
MTVFAPGSAEYRQLFGVSYRLLGSTHDAEDAVQEGLARWQELTADQQAEIREPVAWLTTVVSRISLDVLGSARARRENYTGIWLPEPVLGSAGVADPLHSNRFTDPEDAVTLDESVSLALLVAMEQLTPGERVSLILHDVFGLPFAEIAEIVGRSPDACRQLASTARRHVRAGRRFEVPGPDRDRVVQAFAAACLGGDIRALVSVLDPDVVSRADGGEHVNAAKRTLTGADAVARYLLGLVSKYGADGTASIELVNGRTGIVLRTAGQVTGVLDLGVVDGRVAEIALVVNPEKLA